MNGWRARPSLIKTLFRLSDEENGAIVSAVLFTSVLGMSPTPSEEVLIPIENVSRNTIDITLHFTDHWNGIMGDQSSSVGPLAPMSANSNTSHPQKFYSALMNRF